MSFTCFADFDCSQLEGLAAVVAAAPVTWLLVTAWRRVPKGVTGRWLLGVGLVLVGLAGERLGAALLFGLVALLMTWRSGCNVGCIGGAPWWADMVLQVAASLVFAALAVHLRPGEPRGRLRGR